MPLLAANWKMFKGPGETREFLAAFEPPEGVDIVVCPPFASLGAAVESGLTVFAQNVHWADEGAYTGDRKSTRLNSSHRCISYAVFCLKKKKIKNIIQIKQLN